MDKTIGIIRQMDDVGRLVIPMEFRRLFDINEGDMMQIQAVDGYLMVGKYVPGCALCGTKGDLIKVEKTKRSVCKSCADTIKRSVF